jgi:hypothetical protein
MNDLPSGCAKVALASRVGGRRVLLQESDRAGVHRGTNFTTTASGAFVLINLSAQFDYTMSFSKNRNGTCAWLD